MAIDKVIPFTTHVSAIKDELFQEQYKGWHYHENENNHCLSYYSKKVNGIFVKYMPMHKDDSLYLDFNPAVLLQGDNIASIYCCNLYQLHNIIRRKLNGVLNIDVLPNIRYWPVSYYENNINIIRDSASIKALYDTILKLKNLGKFKKKVYEDQGTIYFYNGATRQDSDYEIKVYYKLRQILNTVPGAKIDDYYNSDLICLNPGQDILRIEIALKRDSIFKLFKPIITPSSSNEKYHYLKPVGTLEEIFNFEKQLYIMNNVIKDFHLDKVITTKDKLITLIDESKDLSIKKERTAKGVVKYINGDSHKKKPGQSTIYKYKKWILDKGYHYLYADVEVKSIILDDIIKGLPEKQQNFIRWYKNSNIDYDIFCSNIPSRI